MDYTEFFRRGLNGLGGLSRFLSIAEYIPNTAQPIKSAQSA